MSQRRAKAELSPSAAALDPRQDSPLAIIAGGGTLPLVLAAAASAQGRAVHVIGIRGEADAKISGFPHTWLKWGEVGKLFATLEGLGCRDLVIIGSVSRPDLANVRFDFGAIKNLPFLLSLGVGGDDQVLSSVVRFLEGKGYRVYGAGEVAPELLAAEGSLGPKAPSPEDRADIETGFRVVSALGRLDVGQAAVVVKLPLATNARAKMQGFRDGFVKLIARRSSGVVLGGVVVAPIASELILPIARAVQNGSTVDEIANAFSVYPSLSGSITEAARRLVAHHFLD